ncbi:hypothetical protein EVAR_19049_1 [Eumeta japonica]|uniref:Uncharacterized protein n=1 Tax=Eumeta variegata TaxID=151549 RepID=A0A4C1V732_EUMVA|nr:hypothetical protein EVAR_19049_1 [Eumeta japonica]
MTAPPPAGRAFAPRPPRARNAVPSVPPAPPPSHARHVAFRLVQTVVFTAGRGREIVLRSPSKGVATVDRVDGNKCVFEGCPPTASSMRRTRRERRVIIQRGSYKVSGTSFDCRRRGTN